MQIVQKIYIECQEMSPDMKIKTGHFWFNNKKYNIIDGVINISDLQGENSPFVQSVKQNLEDFYKREEKGENND